MDFIRQGICVLLLLLSQNMLGQHNNEIAIEGSSQNSLIQMKHYKYDRVPQSSISYNNLYLHKYDMTFDIYYQNWIGRKYDISNPYGNNDPFGAVLTGGLHMLYYKLSQKPKKYMLFDKYSLENKSNMLLKR